MSACLVILRKENQPEALRIVLDDTSCALLALHHLQIQASATCMTPRLHQIGLFTFESLCKVPLVLCTRCELSYSQTLTIALFTISQLQTTKNENEGWPHNWSKLGVWFDISKKIEREKNCLKWIPSAVETFLIHGTSSISTSTQFLRVPIAQAINRNLDCD